MLGTHISTGPVRMSGFTIVELMITVTVASILLAVAVPSFNEMMRNSRITAQANEFVAAINFARSEAIKRNTSMTLCRAAALNPNACAGTAGNWQQWIVKPVAPPDAAVVRRGVVNEFSGGLVVRSTLTGDQVVFGGDGLARTGGMIIDEQRINVCTTNSADPETRRGVVLGSASRLFTEKFEGNC